MLQMVKQGQVSIAVQVILCISLLFVFISSSDLINVPHKEHISHLSLHKHMSSLVKKA